MTTYRIKVHFKTGDSFKSYDEERTLEPSWTNLDRAKLALKRIKEHWDWYEDKESWRPKGIAEPEWHKGQQYDFCIMLPLDEGEMQFSAGLWCGYFEELYGAKIVIDMPEDSDMEFGY